MDDIGSGVGMLAAVGRVMVGLMLFAGISSDIQLSLGMEEQRMIMRINGELSESQAVPYKEGRKLFLPLREVFEKTGWDVAWKDGVITVTYTSSNEQGTRRSSTFFHEGDYPVKDGTAYINAKTFVSMTKAELKWDQVSDEVSIVSGDPHYMSEEEKLRIDSLFEGKQEVREERTFTEQESQAINFGKYDIPPTLQGLLDLAIEFHEEGQEIYDVLGFYPSTNHSRYFNTPVDVVAFGWTGGDGEHYGILTDFGSAENLENAPVVLVSPMSFDQPARVVANNIREFLSIVMIDSSLLYMGYEDEAAYLESMRAMEEETKPDYWVEETPAEKATKAMMKDRLQQRLSLPVIPDPYTYSEGVAKVRQNRVVVATKDQLGITNRYPSDTGRQHTTLLVDEDLEVEELEDFLASATDAAKLAVVRDFNLDTLGHRKSILETLIRTLRELGLEDEAVRMEAVDRY